MWKFTKFLWNVCNYKSFFATHYLFFSSNITYFLQQWPFKVQIFRLSSTHFKVHHVIHFKNFSCHFSIKRSVFFKVWIFFHSYKRIFFCHFLAETLYAIDISRTTSKWKFSDLQLIALIFTKFLMSLLEPTVSFSSIFASLFSVMRYNSSVPFHLNLYINFYKKGPSKCKFPDFWLLAWKVIKFLRSFFLPRVSFPLKFASSFIVMTHNFYEMFYLKHYILLTERAHQCAIFQTVSALMKMHPILYVIFATTTSGFIQSLHHCLVSSKITPLYF